MLSSRLLVHVTVLCHRHRRTVNAGLFVLYMQGAYTDSLTSPLEKRTESADGC